MKTIDAERLSDMIQTYLDLIELKEMGLTNEEIQGYIEAFADNIIKPMTTVTGSKYEN